MKRKNFMRALALAMTLSTVAGTVPVMAVETETETEMAASGANGDVSFELDIEDTFNLAIPKSIVLTKNADGNYDADYNIKMVSCDISPTKQVAVSSNAEIEISREGSEDKKTATNDMDKSVDEIQSKITFADKSKDVIYTGYMNAGVLTSGSWQTQTAFTIALEDKQIDDTTQAVTKEAGLYDAEGTMLCALTKEQVEMNYNYDNVLPQTLGVDKTQVAEVVIPEGTTKIGDYAFGYCSGLTSITIPDGVTSIGKFAFINCSSLTSITIPDGVTSIGINTFYGCSNLKSVTIPNSVTSIKTGAFRDCTSLILTIPDTVTSIEMYAFKNVPHIYYNGTATGSPWDAIAIN